MARSYLVTIRGWKGSYEYGIGGLIMDVLIIN